MPVKLGSIEFDEEAVKPQLRRDLQDDWFPDPLRFKDLFRDGRLEDLVNMNLKNHHGEFQATRRSLFNIPKGNFTLRYGLEFGLPERALYHGITMKLVKHYDPLIPWSVFSHRASENPLGKSLYKIPVQAWQDFVGIVRANLTDEQVLLSTDLSN